jgi:C-methyltransferase-like protein
MPDLALVLVWNLAQEVSSQQASYRAQGGRFIIPIPVVRLV